VVQVVDQQVTLDLALVQAQQVKVFRVVIHWCVPLLQGIQEEVEVALEGQAKAVLAIILLMLLTVSQLLLVQLLLQNILVVEMAAQEYFTVFLDKNVRMVVVVAEIFSTVHYQTVSVEQADRALVAMDHQVLIYQKVINMVMTALLIQVAVAVAVIIMLQALLAQDLAVVIVQEQADLVLFMFGILQVH
jgi:hypothetical protein